MKPGLFYGTLSILILVLLLTVSARTPALRIPFKEDHDSKFIFQLEQFDDEKLLDCTGEILIRNLTENLVFNYRNFKVHRNVNLKRSTAKSATSLPVIMKVGDRKIFEPKEYDNYAWIDPRIISKIIKYTNIDEFGRVMEESWEVSDLECPPTLNTTDTGGNCQQMEFKYELQDCIDPVEDEVVEAHFRIIKFSVDKATNLITQIDYHYCKSNKEFDKQNTAKIIFQGFEKY